MGKSLTYIGSTVDFAAAAAKSLQLCPTLWDPIDGSPPGSPIPGIIQARTLEWVAISFSNAWKWKVKVKSVSCARLLSTPWTAAYQAPPSMGFSRKEYWSGLPLPSLINTYVSIITLNVNELNAPIKRTKWQTGLKNKSLQYAAYSVRPTLGQRTHMGWKWGNGKNIFHTNGNDKKGVAVLISDKTDFKQRL